MKKSNEKILLIDLLNSFIAVAIYILLFYLVIRFLPKLVLFFLPLIFGIIISIISNRLVTRCEEKLNIPRKRTSLLIVIFVTVVLASIIFGVSFYIYKIILNSSIDVRIFIRDINSVINETERFVNNILSNSPFSTNMTKISIPLITADNVMSHINLILEPIVNFSVNFIKNIPVVIVNVVFAIISAYVLIIDNKSIRKNLKKVLPKSVYNFYKYMKTELLIIFNGWLKVQIIVVGLVFLVLLIGLLVVKVKHPFLLALFITIVDALPIFGSGFILWPWAVYCIIQKEIFKFIVILLMYLGVQFIRNVIQNRIMSSDYGLNPAFTILILFLGFNLYGFIGLIFAIPIGVLLMSLYKFGLFDGFITALKKLFSYLKIFLT